MKNNKKILSEINSLINMLNYHTQLYNEGKPVISDKEWDDMYFQLQKLENEHNIYLEGSPTQNIIYKSVTQLQKVKHNHPMLSLDKTKDWNEFVRYFNYHDVVGMLKLDGLTCSLRYINGELVSAETRGNGEEGEDIYHNALVIKNIPKKINYKDELIIDGEIICTTHNFESFKDEYANPRNFASGSIRLLDSKECEKRNLSFVVWHIVEGFGTNVIDKFVKAQELGFTVVPWTSSFDWDAKEFLIDKAKEFGYPIDGLVGRFTDTQFGESLGTTGHHSRAAYAFKFYDDEYKTSLKDIEFTMGRTGILTPVAVFKSIEIEGSVIERASLHNLTIMEEIFNGTPFVGQEVFVYRANMIIPQIASADYIDPNFLHYPDLPFIDIPTECPICGAKLDIECEVNTKVLKCNNNDCGGRLVNRLDHFCGKKGLDIKGLSKATLEKLIDWGWVSQPADLYKLNDKKSEWIKKAGFGEKSVENILVAIEESRYPTLEAFISALGIPLIGKTISKELIKYVNSYEDFRDKAKSKWDFTKIDGIAYEKASAIWNFNFDEADRVDEYILGYLIEEKIQTTNTLESMNIVVTGRLTKFKNRNELIKSIEDHGGKVINSVSKNTSILINNDINSNSTKNVAAQRLNIPIMTEEEFFNLYLTN